jgi:sortase (surface protein transpeptidase)
MSLEIEFAEKRHMTRWVILILVIGLLVASGWVTYRWYTTGQLPPLPLPFATADTSVDESSVSSLEVSQYTVSALQPRYIDIPSIELTDTRIYPINLSTSNSLLTYASNIHDVGWYEKSNTPGNGGVVLLDGHAKGVSQTGPFLHVGDLVKGSKIIIKRGDGTIFTYSVVDVQNLTTDDLYTTGLSLMSKAAESNTESLNIVADAGTWIPKLNMFDHRILVRSSLTDTPSN